MVASDGRTAPLTNGRSWAIGRTDGCALVLDSRSVSRLHALVQRLENGSFCLIDLGSRNGSYVNGRRVSVPQALADGDDLVLGDSHIRFHCTSGAIPTVRATDTGVATSALLAHSLVSVLVVDIRGFTRLTRSVDEELLSRTIGSWFLRVGQIAQKYRSWAQEYIGDAVMAVWQHEGSARVEYDAMDVLRAVCEMAEATPRLGVELGLPQPLLIGAGVSTGMAIVGNSDFTALGDTVTAAFRIESATRNLDEDVALSRRVFEALSGRPSAASYFREHTVELKGYDEPARIWTTTFGKLREFVDG